MLRGVFIGVEIDDLATFEYGTQSVSYTHLRAHETVLDLVCRLLLEKKKRHKTSHDSIPPIVPQYVKTN